MKQYNLSASVFAVLCALTSSGYAQSAEVTPYVAKSLSPAALNNILNSENVFCYNVAKAPAGYTGYTLNQLALTGYCGQLHDEKEVFVEGFFKTPSNILETTADCQIEPKIMFRFVRGVDSTDVLFSDTCPSVTIFYAGTIKAFNAAPAKKPLEQIASIFGQSKTEFISPALLTELMPVGVILNDEQQALVNEQKKAKPVRNWTQPSQPQSNPEQKPTKPQGWNKLGKK